MNAPARPGEFTVHFHPRRGDGALADLLRREIEGEVLFDRFSRGRYSTDASIYQVDPVGVVIPRNERDAETAFRIALDQGIPVMPRGGGTSQCGQTVGAALVIDLSRHVNQVLEFDKEARTVWVQPGIVLDHLNAWLKPHGLWYPVDVSTSAQATIGGMTGNNSCGSRSIHYGNMVDNVLAVEAITAAGDAFMFDESAPSHPVYRGLVDRVQGIVKRELEEIAFRYPDVIRNVAGYNLNRLVQPGFNMAHLLVGSEGTLAYSRRIKLKLSPLPVHKALGVCHFPTFRQAMDAAQHIVKLGPVAVEAVDRTMIALARSNPAFLPIVERCVKGDPDAILLVEFAGDGSPENQAENLRRLKQLGELMADQLGLPGGVVEITDAKLQKELWDVRKAGLNIMMSMKGDGKPVSFIEDCAVPLEHLADYTSRLTEVFHRNGTTGTWYAHASVGCLHVRPILDMRREGAVQMRAIADEAMALVREYKGAYSGEHGDGLVRSEWIEPFYGSKLTRAFEEVKDLFDPRGLLNPGKIVRPPKQDDRTLYRFKPGYAADPIDTALDWSDATEDATAPGARSAGFSKAIEACNNNGHCRKFDAGTMCPSYRATGDEQHLTRGRANTLRLAISGQLGPDAFTSEEMYRTMELCVSCKGCKRECPTGVDMAKMKVEFLGHYKKKHGLTLRDRLVAFLPRYAPLASRFSALMNLRNALPGAATLSEKFTGLSARRSLPTWHRRPFHDREAAADGSAATAAPQPGREVVLLVDTFNRYFEPENARAAIAVLRAAGYTVHTAKAADSDRPLCCGRTFLSAGLVDEAKAEARRSLDALKPYVERGVPVVGLEPSCLLGLRDEWQSMLPKAEAAPVGAAALLFEEFLARELSAGRLQLPLKAIEQTKAMLHGHCHQKAFDAMPAVEQVLKLVPGLSVETIEATCCGMAGSFGYEAEHYETSMKIGELSVLPKMRAAAGDALLVADGTSCRHQIRDGAQRGAVHVARVLERALATGGGR
ncbi:MAG: FAD-binding protein [Rhodocyclaceae bacterium]|nr:FAD-binding protein [Rhodocyclaceae bacterium]MCA3073346.1 FAD-binding protein [Rhodocyclaceae bacterium]MCA3091386.1 FAD-binding protein [Rhodocyclaceae bacterium]MCA3094195.1 FAD-binding protein [Rhodocyclaceae bacterium]MCA3098369.1 FAD-binding protein [Rhodocyclaceae bacterium]